MITNQNQKRNAFNTSLGPPSLRASRLNARQGCEKEEFKYRIFSPAFHRSTWCDGVVLELAGSVEFILRGLTTFSEFPSNDFWFSAEIAEMSWYWKDFSFRMHCSYLFLISWLLSQFLFTLKYVASCDVRAALRSYLNPIWDFFASQILSKNKGGSFISRC